MNINYESLQGQGTVSTRVKRAYHRVFLVIIKDPYSRLEVPFSDIAFLSPAYGVSGTNDEASALRI